MLQHVKGVAIGQRLSGDQTEKREQREWRSASRSRGRFTGVLALKEA